MKKIMFNDKYGLTQAVLDGRKTQTRRMAAIQPPYKNSEICFPTVLLLEDEPEKHPLWLAYCWRNKDNPEEYTPWIKPKYKEGEVVAIAQSYKDLGYSPEEPLQEEAGYYPHIKNASGWTNKMFVRADIMPHRIRITKVRMQRLQDISDEDCLAEGVVKIVHSIPTKAPQYITGYYPSMSLKEAADKLGWGRAYSTPQYAYADLIDKVSGEGTWESNPWVWVYEFELMK